MSALAPNSYRGWLAHNAIAYVALPDAPLDYSARAEATLLRGGASGPREVWRSPHWRLFAVPAAAPLAQPPSELTQLGTDSFALRRPAAGPLRRARALHALLGAALGARLRAAGPRRLDRGASAGAGELRVGIGFSPLRAFERGPRCR